MSTHAAETNCSHCQSRMHGIFCTLKQNELTSLSLEKNSNTYKKGQTLFLEGNPSFGIYCISHGKIKVSKTGANGKETIIRIATEGDVLGHQNVFSHSIHNESATALEDTQVCFVSKNTLKVLIQSDPSLSIEIIKKLSSEMEDNEEKITSLAQKSVRERFAELLIYLNEHFGKKDKSGNSIIDVKLTREEMASMIGAAPENLIRLVTEFKTDGLIKQEGKLIYLLDIPKIEYYASL